MANVGLLELDAKMTNVMIRGVFDSGKHASDR